MSGKKYKKLSVFKLSSKFSEAIKQVETELVDPKEDEILIKNMFVGINATDILMSGGYQSKGIKPELPYDIGFDAVGIVEKLGPKAKGLKVGQPVMVCDWTARAYAEYLYAKPEGVFVVPQMRPEFAALRSGLTAFIGLEQAGHIKKGERVLITSATGGTGHICIQLAKQKDCHVIGMTSSEEKAKVIKDLGCDRVINYKMENVDEVLRTQYPSGVDVIWETIGGRVCEILFRHLAERGRFLIIGGISGYKSFGFPDVSFPIVPNELLYRNQSLTGFTVEGYPELYKQYSRNLIEMFDTKKLQIIVDFGETSKGGPFDGIESVVRAVEHLKMRKTCGKVVVRLQKS